MADPGDELLALEHALSVLDASREGVLQFAGETIPIRFIVNGANGRLIASIPAAALLAVDAVLHVPEETPDALQLQLSLDEAQEGPATDQWQAHHGQPEHVRWSEFTIDAARHGAWVFDGDAMMRPNTVAPGEAALCRTLNSDKPRLAALCQRFAGLVVPDPTCVAVDPAGIVVRARFGVVRVFFPQRAADAEAAKSQIESMLGQL